MPKFASPGLFIPAAIDLLADTEGGYPGRESFRNYILLLDGWGVRPVKKQSRRNTLHYKFCHLR